MYCLRRAAFRALSFSPSTCVTTKQRTFTSITSRVQRSAPSKPSVLLIQKRWLADEAAATQSEPEADGAALTEDANNSISQDADPASEPPKTEEQAAETIQSADSPTSTIQPESVQEQEPKSTFQQATDAATLGAEAAAEAISSGAASLSQSVGYSGRREMREPQKPAKQLYVGNLFFDIRGEDLQKEFSRAGKVVSARVITDQRGLSKGFGYVEFEDVATAEKAAQMFNQMNFEGRRMTVQYADPNRQLNRGPTRSDRPRTTPTRTLFIGNMSFEMSDRDLNDLFRQVKNVVDVRVAIDRRTGQPRGFAHADFTDVESAEKASEVLTGKMVQGRQLRVDFSHSSGRAAMSNGP